MDAYCKRLNTALNAAAERHLPKHAFERKRPWISDATLDLIQQRQEARIAGDWEREKTLYKKTKLSVKRDRGAWLEDMLQTGDWSAVRKIRKGPTPTQGRLKNLAGELVSSECRAEAMAEYLENVHWAPRPTLPAACADMLGATLPVRTDSIDENEVISAATKLKRNRACGVDGIPPEFWKAVLQKGSPSCQWAVELCRLCWETKSVPKEWHLSRVATIFKKGDVAACSNYRPISLLQIGYKIFAIVLLSRLKAAGAESRIWPTQFGFRSKRGTADALFVARRLLDDAWAAADGKLVLLALDWAKAFDCIEPQSPMIALHRLDFLLNWWTWSNRSMSTGSFSCATWAYHQTNTRSMQESAKVAH